MSAYGNKASHSTFGVSLALGSLLLLTCTVYWPGLNGPFQLDDFPNLESIGFNGGIQTLNDALNFIFAGGAGPSGRPLSLASFVIHDVAWPTDPWPFKFTGLMLHLINGLFVFWLVLLITRTQSLPEKHAQLCAVFVSGLWLLHPMHLSTTLYVIQRMTELSTLFTLMGLILFIKGRNKLTTQPLYAFILLSIGIGGIGSVAVLCKESGFLIVFYALTLEYALFRTDASSSLKLYRYWKGFFLFMPIAALCVYIVFINQLAGYEIRSFTLEERLLTQPGVLLHYLANILSPNLVGSGLFHDDYPLSKSLLQPPSTLFYLLAIAALLLLAWRTRRKWPVLSFGLCWFFAGHLLESTALPLELYFEHRNYLPMLGILFVIGYYALQTPPRLRPLIHVAFGLIIVTFSLSNWQNALVWGNAQAQPRIWAEENSSSIRAQQLYAAQLSRTGQFEKARSLLIETQTFHPLDPSLFLQVILLSCVMEKPAPYNISHLEDVFKRSNFSFAASHSLQNMLISINEGQCQKITHNELLIAVDSLIANPKFLPIKVTLANLYYIKGEIHMALRQLDPTIQALDKSFEYNPRSDVLILQARLLWSAGLFTDALDFINKAQQFEAGEKFPNAQTLDEIQQISSDFLKQTEGTE